MHHKQYICSECQQPCNGKLVDFGIGSYEYWGQKCTDTNKQWVSDCCEAPLLDENGNEADQPEDPRNEYNPDEERSIHWD